jgi:ubiquinone/menaquinone biosynthesis C-methylase UbiE
MRKFLAFFYQGLYHRFAWTYDLVAAIVSIGRWQSWGRTSLAAIRGSSVLEIGFGPGHLQLELNRQGIRVFGLDESRQMIRHARNLLHKNRFPAALTQGHAQSLPYPAGTFDTVAAIFPSEYITHPATLAEIHRVLKPAGRLVVIPSAWIGGRSLPDAVARWLFRVTGQGESLTEGLEGRLEAIFGEAGFRVEIVYTEIRQSTVLTVIAEKPKTE